MSSTVSPVDQTEVRTDKHVVESVVLEKPTSSEQTESFKTNDIGSSTRHENIPLKRDSSDITGSEEKTPARTKKTRTDRFKEESEALLKSFGLEDGPGSEKRLTRSRTGRGTPASTPVSKLDPVKQTTGSKRGRKPSEKKEQLAGDDDTPAKTGPRKGRGRPKQSTVVDNGENNSAAEESSVKVEATLSTAGDQNEKQTDVKEEPEKTTDDKASSVKESKVKVPEVVVTKEEDTNSSIDKTNDNATNSESKPDHLAVQKEEAKEKLTNLNESKPVENSKETTAIINSNDEKLTPNDTITSKVENNLINNNNQPVNEQVKKIESVDQSAKTEQSTEKVVESNKLSSESVEKQEVQTA